MAIKNHSTGPALTAARLRELLHYDPETGEFRWRIHRAGTAVAGQIAGNTQRPNPRYRRRRIGVDYVEYKANRLAWLYMTGEWPDGLVDHIDTDPMNNRWSNLRLATQAQNQWNVGLRRNNTTGRTGVTYDKRRNQWRAEVHIHIGRFATREEAYEAYRHAIRGLRGEFFR